MAKKSDSTWGKLGKIAVEGAKLYLSPTAYAAEKVIKKGIETFTEDSEPEPQEDELDLVCDALDNGQYEEALEFLQKVKDGITSFDYYYLSGECHYGLHQDNVEEWLEKCKVLGIDDDTEDDDPLWEKAATFYDGSEKEKAYSLFRQCLKFKETDEESSFFSGKLPRIYWLLTDLCESDSEKRRYDIAAMKDDEIRSKAIQEYKEVTNSLIYDYDDGYVSLQKALSDEDPVHYPKDSERFLKICRSQLFSSIDYHERQFIYIAKDIDALAGCYDESISWLFTIKQLPKELQFPVGHPQPNALYYAHPARKGYYMPIEGADEKLFIDKVQDFYRLAQGLGATEISFRLVKGHANTESILTGHSIEVGGDYKGVGGNAGYDRKRGKSSKSTQQNERQQVERFNPTKKPYVPEDVHWLSVDDEWQRLVKMRMEGNMLHHSVRISSKKTMDVSESRMDTVKAAFKSFVANANMSFSRQMEKSFSREEEMEYEISVTFKPLNEFESMEGKAEKQVMNTNNKLSSAEQQYLDAVKECLEDGAEITPRDRRMLERIRTSLGISEKRAKELEASLAPQLTDEEMEYLETYREYVEEGEIGEKERRKLDRFAGVLNIPAERIKDIERMA